MFPNSDQREFVQQQEARILLPRCIPKTKRDFEWVADEFINCGDVLFSLNHKTQYNAPIVSIKVHSVNPWDY